MTVTRRAWMGMVLGGAALALTGEAAAAAADPTLVTVYKTPTCGCCTKWVDHILESGFRARVHDLPDLGRIKAQHGVPRALSSCHTSLVGGYVVEGHVPADVIRQLLAERPQGVGIAVPGMPLGSPGMEAPRTERYDVLLFDDAGRIRVFAQR
jgi:hypothetical protein